MGEEKGGVGGEISGVGGNDPCVGDYSDSELGEVRFGLLGDGFAEAREDAGGGCDEGDGYFGIG